MKKLILTLVLLFCLSNVEATVYYVTTSGNNSNNGLTEGTAWLTIQKAFDVAVAGDIVYIKAGNYGNATNDSVRAGTAGNPIKFIGYRNTINDINALNGPTFSFQDWKDNGEELNTPLMPFLNNNKDIPVTGERAFDLNHGYIEIRNIMLAKYWIGFDITAPNITLDNVIGDQFGTWNPADGCWNATDDGCNASTAHRNGWGILANGGSHNISVTNSMIIDAGFVSCFIIASDNYNIQDFYGISYNPGNGSDYIIDIYNSDNGTVENTFSYRFPDASIGHRSRGLIFQAACSGITVNNVEMVNLRMQLNHVEDFVMNDVNIHAEDASGNTDNDGSLQFSVHARNGTIRNLRIDNSGGIAFLGNDDGVGPEIWPVTAGGENIQIINPIITRIANFGGNGIVVNHRLNPGQLTLLGPDNVQIIGGTFDDFNEITSVNRAGNLDFINCTFSNAKGGQFDHFYSCSFCTDYTNNYTLTFTNTNWAPSNSYAIPAGGQWIQSNTSHYAPDFVVSGANPYALNSTSLLRNIGANVVGTYPAYSLDYLNATRDSSPDIGAYEYGGGTPPPPPDPVATSLLGKKKNGMQVIIF